MEHFTDTAISLKSFPTGKGIGIAILDTGISPVADFTIPTDRIIAFRDFINGRTTPYDDNGHGTHVTGAKKETTPMFAHRRRFFPFSYNALYVGVRDYPICLLEHEKCYQYDDASIYQVAASIFTPLHDFFAFLL